MQRFCRHCHKPINDKGTVILDAEPLHNRVHTFWTHQEPSACIVAIPEQFMPFSSFNFQPEEWRAAAERFLILEDAINELDSKDHAIRHDDIYEEFGNCETCIELNHHLNLKKEFSERFAEVWAKQLLTTVEVRLELSEVQS
jgi:hypothetical protein